ncbi:MAG TPA: hypothetical protein VNK43_05660 [Gemmatimonadales bacterium]|nr:hypothetical protein [Gemmatimonadales bacterium]
MRSRGLLFLAGALLGVTAGWMLVQDQLARHRANLFSPKPLKRLAALGYLAGQHSVETVRLLRDYLAWESEPMLRRRAAAIARRMEATLG